MHEFIRMTFAKDGRIMKENTKIERLAHIERLIVRKLDGEISEGEQLELDRELIRSADVRALYESYCEIDDLAADVIRTSARGAGDGEEMSVPVLRVRHEVVAHQPRHHKWMVYASGLAACLALVLIWKTPGSNYQPSPTQRPQAGNVDDGGWGGFSGNPMNAAQLNAAHRNSILGDEIGVWNVADLPQQRLDRTTDQNLILVPTDNGGYYLLRMDHVRKVRQPKDQAEALHWNRPI